MQSNRHSARRDQARGRSTPHTGDWRGKGRGRGSRGRLRQRGAPRCRPGSDCPYMVNDACAYAHTAADRAAAAAAGVARDAMAIRVLERADRHINLGLFADALSMVCSLDIVVRSGPGMHSGYHHDPRLMMARQDVAGGHGWVRRHPTDLSSDPPVILPTAVQAVHLAQAWPPDPADDAERARVHDATNPWRPLSRWSPATHHTFSANHRDGVHALCLVRARVDARWLDQTYKTGADLPGNVADSPETPGSVPPRLPPELWDRIFQLMQMPRHPHLTEPAAADAATAAAAAATRRQLSACDHTGMETMRLRLRFVAAVGVATRRLEQLAAAADAALANGDHRTARFHLGRAGMYDTMPGFYCRYNNPERAAPTQAMFEIKERVDEACRAAEARSAAELARELAQVDPAYEHFLAELEADAAEVDLAYEQFLAEMEEGAVAANDGAAAEMGPETAAAFEDFLDEFEDFLDEVEAAYEFDVEGGDDRGFWL